MAAERGASENTCLAYQRDLQDFTGWLTKRPHDVTEADSADIRDFLTALARRGLAELALGRGHLRAQLLLLVLLLHHLHLQLAQGDIGRYREI